MLGRLERIHLRDIRQSEASDFTPWPGRSEKRDFAALLAQRDAIEAEFGAPLVWIELPERKRARVGLLRDAIEPFLSEHRDEVMSWIGAHLVRLDKAFRQRSRALEN